MAKTTYLTIPTGFDDQYWKGLKSSDRFVIPRVSRNDTLISRYRKKGLSQKSLLPQISALWAELSTDTKDSWSLAGAECGLSGWQLFVQDTAYRIINEIEGVASPSLLHQSFVGKILIGGTATGIKLAQYHPNTYWVQQKVTGTKNMYQPKLVTESFGLPLQIGLNYKADMYGWSENSNIHFYAQIFNSYQGKDDSKIIDIPLDWSSPWTSVSAQLDSFRGTIIGYNLFLEAVDMQGTLLFDNVKAIHGGTNWARDPYCKNIDITFTKAFYQIPKHWVAVSLPEGAEYDSVYPDS